MSKIVTKDGITVAVGQRWKSLESAKRGVYEFENGRTKLVGYERIVIIERVDEHNGVAYYKDPKRPRASGKRIRIERMHKHATGWELVKT